MDPDGSDSGWETLGHDIQLSILSVLKQRKDKVSLQAMMQTSRDLRLLASSLISSIEIRDASALAHYPTHAAAINLIQLRMRPSPEEAHMEPPGMVIWLRATSAACFSRLAAITSVHVELPGMLQAMDPVTMDSLLASIARACPSLRCLSMDCIDRTDEDLVHAMFAAIGQHLPGIIELQLELDISADVYNFAIAGIDWAACLPRNLQKFSSYINLHHELLQQLVLMPALTEVEVWSLSTGEEERREVQSEACAWRILRLESGYPSCQELGRFTSAMPLLHLNCYDSSWYLGADVEGPIVAKAASWLSQIRNRPEELTLALSPATAASAARLISSLAPLSGPLLSLELRYWPVTERTLDELAETLPNVHKLNLRGCSISDSAWFRMLSLASVTDLTIYQSSVGGGSISLAEISAFTSAITRPMALTFMIGAGSEDAQAGWEAFEEEQRRKSGLLHITVHITQEY